MKRPTPLHAVEKDKASRLIGKRVLYANDREGLGYYGVLIGFSETNGKFLVRTDVPGFAGRTIECNWIVEYIQLELC